jgi:hypothetical protein
MSLFLLGNGVDDRPAQKHPDKTELDFRLVAAIEIKLSFVVLILSASSLS